MADTTEHFFASCPRGLESALADELRELEVSDPATTDGGVAFCGAFELCYRVNLRSRIASRLLWRVHATAYRNEDEVYRAAHALPWPSWFDVGRSIAVSVNARRAPLKSLDFITLRIKDAVCDRFRAERGSRPSVDTRAPEVRVFAFCDQSNVIFYLDTSGDALFRRGARVKAGEAPLKENLAAGILRLSGWRPGTPLLDPMCGGGTFLTEAAQIALNIAPGLGRKFGFEQLRRFDAGHWLRLRQAAESTRLAAQPLAIFGSDRYGAALDIARANAAACGLPDVVQFKQANVLEVRRPAEHGIWLANPPYGERIGEQQELTALYPRLGDKLEKDFGGL